MALGDAYALEAELREFGSLNTATLSSRITDALKTASRGIDGVCHRQFNKADSVTPRVYYSEPSSIVEVDDFYTTIGLMIKIDTSGDGTFATTLSASEYELHPLNGVVMGQPGWPYREIWSTGYTNRLFQPVYGVRRTGIQVTAAWGWTEVPSPVKMACLLVANEAVKLGDAALGVAGVGDNAVMRVKSNPVAMDKLANYIVDPVQVA